MYIVLGAVQGAPNTLVWATKDSVLSAVLEAAPEPATGPSASGSPGPSASAGGSPRASARPSAKASRAP